VKIPVHIVIIPPPPIGRVAEIMQGLSLLWIIITVAAAKETKGRGGGLVIVELNPRYPEGKHWYE